MKGRLRDRVLRRWTIVVVGRESGQRTSLEAMFRFQSQQDALERATKMNGSNPNDCTNFEVERWR